GRPGGRQASFRHRHVAGAESGTHRLNAPTGWVMSPEISMEFFAHPSQEDTVTGQAGTTSATGRPNRVTRTGAPVRRTSSRTAKYVALNLEIAISRIFHVYHSPIPWSEWCTPGCTRRSPMPREPAPAVPARRAG